MKSIIEVHKLSKRYEIRENVAYYSLRDAIVETIKHPLKSISGRKPAFWALSNLSFKVNPGEVIGVIGKNGAGKSTLLKILSRITPPTRGEVILRGRTASLLEIGTGFHPELTGRENIYLNGAILGMSRKEVSSKYDEIVNFSGVEKFLGTPVKHYSSGMYMRLAFAVAAHLEPEILIVDEVLSVGDAEFQKKSLGKMQDVSKQGRTVIFVSHNLSAITSLCQRVILLKDGKMFKTGKGEKVVAEYLRFGQGLLPQVKCANNSCFRNNFMRMIRVQAHDGEEKTLASFDIRKSIGIGIEYQVLQDDIQFAANIQVQNSTGLLLFNTYETEQMKKDNLRAGFYKSTVWVPGNFLAEGLFSVRATLTIFREKKIMEIDYPEAISFNVHDIGEAGSVKKKGNINYPGVIRPKLDWERVKINNLM